MKYILIIILCYFIGCAAGTYVLVDEAGNEFELEEK